MVRWHWASSVCAWCCALQELGQRRRIAVVLWWPVNCCMLNSHFRNYTNRCWSKNETPNVPLWGSDWVRRLRALLFSPSLWSKWFLTTPCQVESFSRRGWCCFSFLPENCWSSSSAESSSETAGIWERDLTIDLLITVKKSTFLGFFSEWKLAFPQALKQSTHLANTGGINHA